MPHPAAGYVCYRVFRRDDVWRVDKLGVAVLATLIVGFSGWVSYQVTSGWRMPAGMLQNINPFSS